jgi:hypothetical protein
LIDTEAVKDDAIWPRNKIWRASMAAIEDWRWERRKFDLPAVMRSKGPEKVC